MQMEQVEAQHDFHDDTMDDMIETFVTNAMLANTRNEEVQTKVSNYRVMNSDSTQRWYDMYEKTQQENIHT